MELLAPTVDWSMLGDKSYRKKELYTMTWRDVDLSKQLLTGAPFGGPIAVTRDDKKLLLVTAEQPLGNRPQVSIYTSSGVPIAAFAWDSKERLVKLGWTFGEKLMLVFNDGSVLVYSLHGEIVHSFNFGKEVKEQGVMDAHVWGTGVMVMTTPKPRLQLFVAQLPADGGEPRVRRLGDTGLDEVPSCWTVIDPQFTQSRVPEVLLALHSGRVVSLGADGRREYSLPDTDGAPPPPPASVGGKGAPAAAAAAASSASAVTFAKMAMSSNGQILAGFTRTGRLIVLFPDFRKILSEFDTQTKVPPQQLVWCGEDSVLLYWDKILLMVGPGNDWIKYPYEEPIALVPEMDGVRVLSRERCELLQKVPNASEATFKIGSTEPSALLYDAVGEFQRKSPKADELIRSIPRQALPAAVDACTEAAGHEWQAHYQRQLLEAAAFGKCFLDDYPSDQFVDMCRTLRVLNAVRQPDVGLPLTLPQYRIVGPDSLVDRLVGRHQHLLALRICEYLRLKPDRVLVHWASVKVRSSSADAESIKEEIIRKLGAVPGISFAEIAATAHRAGRGELATRLLDYEPRAAEQVPLLINMKEDERALQKAVESGDTDLVYLVLLQLKRTRQPAEFVNIVRNKPAALALLLGYARQQDPEMLRDLYYQLDMPNETAALTVQQAYQRTDFEARLKGLQQALTLYGQQQKDAGAQFAARATDDQIRLLMLQRELEQTFGGQYVDLSLTDTLYNVLLAGDVKRAAKIQKEFRVPDKRFYWIKIKALGQMRLWQELEKFAKERKPPIGFECFADVCLEQNVTPEAIKYIAKIVDARVRAEYYMRVLYWREAAESALQAKDPQLLAKIGSKTTSPEIRSFCEQALSQLRK